MGTVNEFSSKEWVEDADGFNSVFSAPVEDEGIEA